MFPMEISIQKLKIFIRLSFVFRKTSQIDSSLFWVYAAGHIIAMNSLMTCPFKNIYPKVCINSKALGQFTDLSYLN